MRVDIRKHENFYAKISRRPGISTDVGHNFTHNSLKAWTTKFYTAAE